MVVAILAVALSACGGGSSGGGNGGGTQPGAGSTFSGTLSDGALLKVTLTNLSAFRSAEVAAATWPLGITGTITPVGGSPIAVTGGFDPDGGTFMLTGGGYTISGSFANDALTATGTAPGGAITLAAYRSDDAAVTVYCGTWQSLPSLPGDPFQAPFSLVFRGSNIKGVTAQPSKPLTLTDTLSGTSFVVYPDGGSGNISGTVTGTGSSSTIAGFVSGNHDGVYGQVGTFSGSVCQ
jgi:hypothetical protein